MIQVRPITPADVQEWAVMRAELWPEAPEAAHRAEAEAYFGATPRGAGTMPEMVLVAVDTSDPTAKLLGFVELSRRPYAEGCETSPVGFLEGWFVVPEWRRRRVGRALVRAAEEWARAVGCREFASDALADNDISRRAHAALGFEEVVMIRCFRKPLLPLALLAMLAGQTAQAQANGRAGIDHLILSASSLRGGMEIFTRLTGITPKVGGQHPGRGTENALVSLGRDLYIEILAPITPAPPSETLHAVGWALRSNAIDELIGRLRTAGFDPVGPTPGSRRTPGGQLLEWRTAGVRGPGLELAPFVIEWGRATPHPAGTSPGGCTLAGVSLILPDTTRLGAFLTTAGVSAPLTVGPARTLRFALDCPTGRVSFTSARAP